MFNIGDTVRVLYPFAESFPDTYVITATAIDFLGQVAYALGDNGSFDAVYLELV
jgi:hypothetical protein